MGCSGGSWGVLIEKLDERMRECSRSGGDCNIKFAFPVKLDRGSPIQGFGLNFFFKDLNGEKDFCKTGWMCLF